jgi:WD40 repeat protein
MTDSQEQAGAAERAAGAPLLMLDTGGHMALIKDIVFTPDGRQLVSASDDKTIRVWDLATGKTVRTSAARARRAMPARSTPWHCRRMANGWQRGEGFTRPNRSKDR